MGLCSMGGEGGGVDHILLLSNLLKTLNQVGYKRNSYVRSPRPQNKLLVFQGGTNLHYPFHHPLPGVCNALLDGDP